MSSLSDKEQEKIKHSIEWAENATSGEVRVCIEKKCDKDSKKCDKDAKKCEKKDKKSSCCSKGKKAE